MIIALKAIFLLVWTAVAVTACGHTLLRRLKIVPENSGIFTAWSAGVGTSCLVLVMMLLGYFGYFSFETALGTLVLFSLVGLSSCRGLIQNWKASRQKTIGEGDRFSWFEKLVLAILLGAVLLNFLDCFAPIISVDARTTYLANPDIYAREGKIIFDKHSISSGSPENVEMLYTFGFLLSGESLARLLNWAMGLGLLFVIYRAADAYFSRRAALLAVAMFYLTGINWFYSVETKVDVCQAWFVVLALSALVEYFRSNKIRFAALGGFFCGISLGVKITSLTFALAPFTLLFALWWIIFDRKKFPLHLKGGLIFLALALVFGAPWYVRNYVQTGNPLNPFYSHRQDLFPKTQITPYSADLFYKPGVEKRERFSQNKLAPWDYLTLPVKWTMRDFTPDFRSGESRIGPLFLLLLPLLIFLRGYPRPVFVLLIFLLAAYGISSKMVPVATRYYYVLFPAAAMLCGYSFYVARERLSAIPLTVLKLVILLALAFQLGSGPLIGNLRSIVSLKMSRDQYLTERLGAQYLMFQSINKNVPAGSVVFVPYDETKYYCERRQVFGRTKNEAEDLFLLNRDVPNAAPRIGSIVETLKERGIRYLVKPDYEIFLRRTNEAPTWFRMNDCQVPTLVIFTPENEQKYLEQVDEARGWKLFKIKD